MKKKGLILFAAASFGCGAQLRFVGMQDPGVETVRAFAQAQVSIVQSLTQALINAQSKSCPVEVK